MEEIPIGSVLLDGRAHDVILRGRGRREHLRDEIRLIGITGSRQMHFIPHPMGRAIATVAGLRVLRGADQQRRGRLFISRAPAECFGPWGRTAVIVLAPNPTQGLRSGEITEAWRALGSHHPVRELIAVRLDLAGEDLAFARVLRQASLFGPLAVAGIPLQGHMLLYRGGGRFTELVGG